MNATAELTQDEKRALIAEACDQPVFRFCGDLDSDGHEPYTDYEALKHLPAHMQGVDTYVRCRKCDGHRWGSTRVWEQHSDAREYPNYFRSLDAMHEAEKTLSEGACISYLGALQMECKGHLMKCVHATASQRAEAFGKTLNLW